MKTHYLAQLFPEITADDYNDLVASIKEHGLINPITTYKGEILDGRHRFKACQQLGIDPRFEELKDTAISPIDFVVAQNIMRRHLTPTQRIVIAVEIIKRRKDQRLNGRKRLANGEGCVYDGVGETLKVKRRAIMRAYSLCKERPDLWEKYRTGKISLNSGYKESLGVASVITVKGKKKVISTKVHSEWDSWVLVKTMVREFGWKVNITFDGEFWRVLFYETKTSPRIEEAIPCGGFREAVKQAASKIYDKDTL